MMNYQNILKKGYLPVDLLLVGEQPVLRFEQYPASVFDGPFIDTAFQNYRSLHGDRPFELVPWSDLEEGSKDNRFTLPEPCGFIFHMSRCGSTLISQMLGQMKELRVVSEPSLLNMLLKSDVKQHHKDVILRSILTSYQSVSPRISNGIVCKFSSQTSVFISDFLRCYPDTPWIYVIRQPREVIASLLTYADSAEARSNSVLDRARLIVGMSQSEIADISMVQLIARMLGRILHSVIDAMSELPALVVDYSELPEVAYSKIAPYFSLNPDLKERRLMSDRSRYRAKGTVKAPFVQSSGWTSRYDAQLIDESAAEWVDESYDFLNKSN